MSFAAYPLAVKIGGEYFCRSISRLKPDGALTFFCAIDEGVVLTLAQPRDIVGDTDRVAGIDETLGGIDLVIGFDCVLRRLDAESRQVRHQLAELYRRYDVVGLRDLRRAVPLDASQPDIYGHRHRSSGTREAGMNGRASRLQPHGRPPRRWRGSPPSSSASTRR